MKEEAVKQYVYDERSLLDNLIGYKLDSETVANSEIAIETICNAVSSFTNIKEGYSLLSITSNDKSRVHLIVKRDTNYRTFKIFSWLIEEKIEKGIEAKIHASGTEDLTAWMDRTIQEYSEKSEDFRGDQDNLVNYIVTEGLTGYIISEKKFRDQCEFLSSHRKRRELEVQNLGDRSLAKSLLAYNSYIREIISEKRQEVRNTIANFIRKLNCEKLNLRIVYNGVDDTSGFHIGRITRVIQNNNVRTYQIKVITAGVDDKNKITETTLISEAKAGISGNYLNVNNLADLWIAETRPGYYEEAQIACFTRIPYNFVDEGRTIISLPRSGGNFDVILGGDPRVDADPEGHIKDVLARYSEALAKNLTKLTGTTIKDGKLQMNYDSFESSVAKDSTEVKPLQIRLKALKKMVDEYQYLEKKQKSIGTDVNISDKVKYNHSEGKVSYNDFSISINDELLKSRLFQTFEKYLVTYYRGETTEETILNDILDKIFDELKSRINSYTKENTCIKINLNGKINIDLEIKTSKNSATLIYLNGQRFNKNEIIVVLREITCYRSQEEADRFISNIGKLGLSVYIGITSGYETQVARSRCLFRFRKLKGRSNYAILLDDIELPIKGKSLISALYAKFIGDHVPDYENKVQKIIYQSVERLSDYVRYKFLIDKAYEAFRTRSQDFLKKKVSDVDGSFCKYWNIKNRKNMDAITLVGMSGHRYVIAYDKKDSYVFLDPQLKEGDKNTWIDGKYVCMIDQSNIKSNIGYDTVISKLMALKNDSVIASTIYNLEEEINE